MIAQKFTVYIALILALIGTGVGIGYSIATKRYEPLIITCNKALDDINEAYNTQKRNQDEKNAELKNQFDDRESRIHAYYDRLLHSKDSNQAGSTTACPVSTNESASEVNADITRQELERDCAIVSNQLFEFQMWITEQNFPVSH